MYAMSSPLPSWKMLLLVSLADSAVKDARPGGLEDGGDGDVITGSNSGVQFAELPLLFLQTVQHPGAAEGDAIGAGQVLIDGLPAVICTVGQVQVPQLYRQAGQAGGGIFHRYGELLPVGNHHLEGGLEDVGELDGGGVVGLQLHHMDGVIMDIVGSRGHLVDLGRLRAGGFPRKSRRLYPSGAGR